MMHSTTKLNVVRRLFTSVGACALFCTFNTGAVAQNAQPLEEIRTAAKRWLAKELASFEAKTEFQIGNLDPRLQLAACDAPLQGFASPGTDLPQISTVGVRCTGSTGWSVYVPVDVTAFREVVVTTRPLARGARLTKADLAIEDRDISKLRGLYLASIEDAIGLELKQSQTAGSVVDRNRLRQARIVKRGQNILLFSEYGPLQVTAPGEALADGAKGEIIRVRNALSRRVIQGRIRDGESVEVIF